MKRVLALFFSLILMQCNLTAKETYEGTNVGKIEIVVENKSAPTTMYERLKTKEGLPFSQVDFDEDLKMFAQEYDLVSPTLSMSGKTLFVAIQLSPKKTIKEITFVNNKAYAAHKLVREFTLKSGALYDNTTFSEAIQKLKSFYINRGYFEITIEPTIAPNSDGTVSVKIAINEGRPGTIDKIIFINFTKKEKEELTELLQTKEYFLLTSWATGDGIHKPELWRFDEMTILNFLHNKGYLDAKIVTKIKDTKNKKRIVLEVTAKKGSLYHFGEVSVSGNKLFTSAELQSLIKCKQGDLFSPEKMHEVAKIISEKYGRKGYVDASCTPDQKMRHKEKVCDVSFVIEEGQCYRVGIIKVLGNTRTQASVILHESLLTPGEVFDATLLGKTEDRLKNTRYFTAVNVYAVKPKEDTVQNNFRDVIIEVQEENSNTAQLKGSVGFSTTEKFVGGVGVSESNFNIAGLPNIFSKGFRAVRGGGEYCSFDVNFGSRMRSYTLSWSKPYFMDTKWNIGADFQYLRNSYASSQYTIKTKSGYFYANYPLNAYMIGGGHYRIAKSKVTLRHITNDKNNKQLIRESQNDGLLSAVGADITYDSRDLPINATKGLHSQVGTEFVGVGGDYTFAKAAYLNSLNYSPYKGGTLTLRGDVQFIKTLGSTGRQDVPLNERLYSGGETTLRGFAYHMVGPKFNDKFRTPRGGFSEVLLSAEYCQQMFKRLDGFVFFDAGNAYFKEFYLGKLRATAGFGIKIKLKEGAAPIVFGFGFPLNPENKRDVKHFFLSFGTSF